MCFISVFLHVPPTLTWFYFPPKPDGFDPKEQNPNFLFGFCELCHCWKAQSLSKYRQWRQQKLDWWAKIWNHLNKTNKKSFLNWFFLLKRKNTDTEQSEKQQTLNVLSQGFGLNASGLENKRDIIRFLLTFICGNTFLPPLLAQSYSRLFSLTSEEESLRLASHCE